MVLPLFDMCAVPRRSPGEAHPQETCRYDREVKGGIIQRHLIRARRGPSHAADREAETLAFVGPSAKPEPNAGRWG